MGKSGAPTPSAEGPPKGATGLSVSNGKDLSGTLNSISSTSDQPENASDTYPRGAKIVSTTDDPTVAALLVNKRPRSFKDIIGEKDPVKRLNDLAYALENIDAIDVESAIEAYEDADDRQRFMEMGYLLYAWGQKDGPAAMAYIDEQDNHMMKFMGGARVMHGWAAEDPDAAFAWAVENGPEGDENPYLAGVAAGAAMNDMGKASEVLEAMNYGRMRGRAVGEVLSTSFQEHGAEATKAWAAEIEEDLLRDGVASRVATKLAEDDGAGALNWAIDVVSEEKQEETIRQVMGTWGRNDPQGLIAWGESSGDPVLKKQSTDTAVRSWAREDPVSAGEWLNTQEKGPELDSTLATYADSIQRRDPASAMTWALNISDTDTRQKMLEEIANDWSRKDPAAAAEYLGTEPPSQEEIDAAKARNERGNGWFGRGGRGR